MSRSRRMAQLLRGAILENFWLKLISLLFALGFYGFIHSAQNMQRTLKVAVVTEMPPHELPRALVTKLPSSVSVTVAGPRQLLDALRDDSVYPIQLDLSAAQDVPELSLRSEMIVGLAPGVRVTKIVPATLAIRFEDKITRDLPVQATHTGRALEGLEARDSSIVIEPKAIKANGGASVVKTMQFARTAPFDVTGLDVGQHSRLLPLIDRPDDVDFEPAAVQVRLEIARKLLTRTFSDVRVDVVGVPRATARPGKVRVVVTGAPARIEALRPEEIVARVEPLAGAAEPPPTGSVYAPVLVEVPDAQVEVHPAKVTVKW